jgi:hypothetical protein
MMEIFVDFGLFEFLAAIGLSALARQIYSRRWLTWIFLAVSLIAPAILIIIASEGLARWIAVFCLATSLLNATLVFSLLRRSNSAPLATRLWGTSETKPMTS